MTAPPRQHRPRRHLLAWVTLVAALLLCGCAGGTFHQVSARDAGALAGMMTDLGQYRAIFIGEYHDRSDHHRLQLEIIRSLHQQGVPLAIGLEMFDRESRETLDQWTGGKLSLQDFVGRYQRAWTIDWAQYDSILLYARNNGIPLVGLNVPDDIIDRVSRGGFNALSPRQLQRLPPGVTVEITPSYRSFLKESFGGHQLEADRFAAFCDAQALRNSTMALEAAAYLTRNPRHTLVVITGIGHAMRRAAPAALATTGWPKSRVIIPLTDGSLPYGIEAGDADYFVTE